MAFPVFFDFKSNSFIFCIFFPPSFFLYFHASLMHTSLMMPSGAERERNEGAGFPKGVSERGRGERLRAGDG